MKTNMIMNRPMGMFNVEQRTKDSMFNATSLLRQWNKSNPNDSRNLDNFWKSTHLKEFMQEIAEKEYNFKSVDYTELKNALTSIKRGRHNGGTWMCPILFIKFAMYLSPKFEYTVIRFVYDQLIEYRHSAGDNYNVLTTSIAKLIDCDYVSVAKAIQWIVFNKTGKDLRQYASQDELKEISEIEKKIAFMIDMNFVNNNAELMNALRKMYNDKQRKF